jgi:hypothetical protein
MPQNDKTKKIAFQGSMARRVFLVCLGLLIIPLFIHSFYLYAREFRLQEETVRTDMRALGSEMARRISDLIQVDWQILELKSIGLTQLASIFHAEEMLSPSNTPGRFALINQARSALIAGVQQSPTEGRAIAHSLTDLLSLRLFLLDEESV